MTTHTKSPNISANSLPNCTIKTGQDKNKWIVLPFSKSQRWYKLIGPIKKYKTVWNGSNPFNIIIAKNMIVIMKWINLNNGNDNDNNDNKLNYKYHSTIKKFLNVYVGKSSSKYSVNKQSFTGNSILIETSKNKFTFIGSKIFNFTLKEPLEQFQSPVQNNLVPYPFIITKNFTYLLLEKVYMENVDYPKGTDPYGSYYKKMLKNKI
jgi:hypothetical protein